MRIVKIPAINGIPQYQDFGGIDDFGPNAVTGNDCIGDYIGSLSEGDLPTYTPPVIPVYRTILTRREFFSSQTGLTGKEQKDIRKYAENESNPYYGEVYELVSQVDVADEVDLKNPETVAGMGLLVSLSLLTSERHDEVMLGIEITE